MAEKWDTKSALAEHLEISNAYLHDILKGARPISNSVAKKLGYRRVIKYAKDGSIEKEVVISFIGSFFYYYQRLCSARKHSNQ